MRDAFFSVLGGAPLAVGGGADLVTLVGKSAGHQLGSPADLATTTS